MTEINQTLDAIQVAFAELKSTNEAKLSEMATKGSVDTLIESKMAAINETISELQKKVARPAIASDVSKEETEHKTAWNRWARKGVGEETLEGLEKKAITITGTDAPGLATGGLLMPKTVEAGIYTSLETLSPIRSEATVI